MLVNVGSGLTGKFLLDRSRRRLEEARQRMREQGLQPTKSSRTALYWDSLTFDVVKQWRVVHFPITLAFAVLATGAHRGRLPVLGLEVKKPPGPADRHRGQPGRAGGAGLRLSAPDGQPGAAGRGTCRTRHRLLCLPRALAWRVVGAMHRVPCRRRHRPAHHEGRAHRQRGTIKGSFHQELIEQDCMACHSDHQGPKLTKRSRKPFSHELLKVAVRDTARHATRRRRTPCTATSSVECGQCHQSKAWKPAHFDHALLAKAGARSMRELPQRADRPAASADPGQLQVVPQDRGLEAGDLRAQQVLRARPRP